MKTSSLKGMNDYLPCEVELRERIEQIIKSCYQENGFRRITTPIVEDIENLDKSEGGDNLNLIFKIMKRGEKLEKALKEGANLCDMGLRYDLTLPLSRYYSAHKDMLEMPFKCIQIDRVYRAERPQKNRLREFVQCDIDIIGSEDENCEKELIAVTAKALLRLDIGTFTIKVNDRRILKAMLLKCGFPEGSLASVSIILDKLDKIGVEGVCEELVNKNMPETAVDELKKIFASMPVSIESISEYADSEDISRLKRIIDDSAAIADGKYKVEFDISLVRGQEYYTGTVFEVRSDEFNGALAGGGRYNGMIGKFTGTNVPACGFSIGFERIYSILSAKSSETTSRKKVALIYDNDFKAAYYKAEQLRVEFDVSLFKRPNKMKSFLDRIAASGFCGFLYENDSDVRYFK